MKLCTPFGSLLALGVLARASHAQAEEAERALVLPPLAVPAQGAAPSAGREQAVTECIVTSAEDLGLQPDTAPKEQRVEEADLPLLAKGQWVFASEVEERGDTLRLRLTVVRPGSRVLHTSIHSFPPVDLPMHCAAAVRDLVSGERALGQAAHPAVAAAPVETVQSPGKPVMAAAGAVYGGYLGYTLQRAGGSEDTRLAYPMIALGAGIGIGAALLASEEWSIGSADAWYLTAAGLWPTISGVALADGYGVQPENERHLYGLLGSAIGISGATVALTFKDMSDGDAAFTHSGGVAGTLVGGLTDLLVQGTTDVTPSRGVGYGAGIGVLLAGALVSQWDAPPASDVMLVDLSAGLGGLAGAAALSPLVFSGEETPDKTRAWLAATLGGLIAGGVVGYFIVDSDDDSQQAPAEQAAKLPFSPTFDWTSVDVNGKSTTRISAGIHGLW